MFIFFQINFFLKFSSDYWGAKKGFCPHPNYWGARARAAPPQSLRLCLSPKRAVPSEDWLTFDRFPAEGKHLIVASATVCQSENVTPEPPARLANFGHLRRDASNLLLLAGPVAAHATRVDHRLEGTDHRGQFGWTNDHCGDD